MTTDKKDVEEKTPIKEKVKGKEVKPKKESLTKAKTKAAKTSPVKVDIDTKKPKKEVDKSSKKAIADDNAPIKVEDNKVRAALLRKSKAIKDHNKLPTYVDFDIRAYHWKGGVDYRKHPELYKVGKGEQGVLLCQPYKGEILVHWKFATPEIAKKGSEAIYKMFEDYLKQDDFVGADMARKFLQMGFTRARRYYNYKGGKKYSDKDYALLERGTGDPQKYESSNIYFKKWREAEAEPKYKQMKIQWRKDYG